MQKIRSFKSYLSTPVHIFDQRGERMKRIEAISWLFEGTLKAALEAGNLEFEKLQEIRLRCNRPVLVVLDGKEWFFTEKGTLSMEECTFCLCKNSCKSLYHGIVCQVIDTVYTFSWLL